MTWTKPDFVEISLNMEVTGYVNTDDQREPTFSDPSEQRKPEDASEKHR
jgi:coenzyme PQQ precursor peptide PqqA